MILINKNNTCCKALNTKMKGFCNIQFVVIITFLINGQTFSQIQESNQDSLSVLDALMSLDDPNQLILKELDTQKRNENGAQKQLPTDCNRLKITMDYLVNANRGRLDRFKNDSLVYIEDIGTKILPELSPEPLVESNRPLTASRFTNFEKLGKDTLAFRIDKGFIEEIRVKFKIIEEMPRVKYIDIIQPGDYGNHHFSHNGWKIPFYRNRFYREEGYEYYFTEPISINFNNNVITMTVYMDDGARCIKYLKPLCAECDRY